jgi:hypothetical protein
MLNSIIKTYFLDVIGEVNFDSVVLFNWNT